MIRAYRHPEQSRGIPSRYLNGFITGSLEFEPDWRFARDDLSVTEAGAPTFSRLARQDPGASFSTNAICSHRQILCCTGFSQACNFCSPSSRRVFTVPSGFLVLAAISR